MITKQEIFDRAYLGLASQGWEKCMSRDGTSCVYSNGRSQRCAWGWVDTRLSSEKGDIADLKLKKIGLAKELDDDSLRLAVELQIAHDDNEKEGMKHALEEIAMKFSLDIPVLQFNYEI